MKNTTNPRESINQSIIQLKHKLQQIETKDVSEFTMESIKYFETILQLRNEVRNLQSQQHQSSNSMIQQLLSTNSVLENEIVQLESMVQKSHHLVTRHLSQKLQLEQSLRIELQELQNVFQTCKLSLEQLEQSHFSLHSKLQTTQTMESTLKREVLQISSLLFKEREKNESLLREVADLKEKLQNTPTKKSVSFRDVNTSPIQSLSITIPKNVIAEEEKSNKIYKDNVSTPRKRSFVNLKAIEEEESSDIFLKDFILQQWFTSTVATHLHQHSSKLVLYRIFDNSKDNPTIQLWNTELHGTFFDEEVYLVICLENQKYHLYCWFGKKCSKHSKEILLSRIHPILVNHYHLIVHIEEQLFESNRFLNLFEKTLLIYNGNYDQFRQNQKRAHLFVAKGNHRLRMFEVPCHINSLQSNHVYVLELPSKLFIYRGSKTSNMSAFHFCASNFCKQQNPAAPIVILSEGDKRQSIIEDAKEFNQVFLNAAEEPCTEKEEEEDVEFMYDENTNPIKLFRVQILDDRTAKFEYLGAMMDEFLSSDIYLIDVLDMNELFIWIGEQSFSSNAILQQLSWLKESVVHAYTSSNKRNCSNIATTIVVEKTLQYKELKGNLTRLLGGEDEKIEELDE